MDNRDSYWKALKTQSDYYMKKGDYRKAYESYVSFSELKDSLFNEELANKIKSITQNFEIEQKQLEIDNLQKAQDLQQAELDKEKERNKRLSQERYMLGGGAFLMLLVIFFVIRSYRLKTKSQQRAF